MFFIKIFLSLLFFPVSFILFSQGTWVQKASLPSVGRCTAVSFTIGNKAYLGTGNVSSGTTDDFWEYTPLTNSWTQKANFGGGARGFACGFAIGNKGYLGTGGVTGGYQNDFWQYDPTSNIWTQVANYGGVGCAAAFGFSVGNKGYVGTGSDNSGSTRNDFWEYNPVTNSWAQKANYTSSRTDIDRAVFLIASKVYIGTGEDAVNFIKMNDFWEYDPAKDSWSQKSNFPGTPRYGATGFSICGNGYLGLGLDSSDNATTDIWKYDSYANSWSAVSSLPGQARIDAPAFVINDKAYIGTGVDGSVMGSVLLNDLWEFTPPVNTPSVSSSANTICIGQTVTLLASGGNNYIWSTGNSTDSIIVSPTVTSNYSVTVSNECTLSVLNAGVTVVNNGIANFSHEYNTCKNACVQFTDQSNNAFTWQWNFGDGSNSDLQNPCHIYNDTTAYSVSLIINKSTACSDSFNIIIPYATHDTVVYIYIPNAFSPNGDGDNDSLKFYLLDNYCLKDFEITIYDRWGEQVFTSIKRSDSWDGTFNGKKLDTQTLTYYCKTITATGRQSLRKGNISLLH